MLDYLRFKEIGELITCGDEAQARKLLMEVQSRCIALQDEMKMLRTRLRQMEEILHLARNLYPEHGFYWLKSNGLRLGPFCPRCFDIDGALIKLEKCGPSLGCPYCGELFRKPGASRSNHPRAKILYFCR